MVEEYYSEAGELVDSIELAPGSAVVVLNIPIGQWHTVQVLEGGTVIMEVKDGAYEPIGRTKMIFDMKAIWIILSLVFRTVVFCAWVLAGR